jgi:hypothetical protein
MFHEDEVGDSVSVMYGNNIDSQYLNILLGLQEGTDTRSSPLKMCRQSTNSCRSSQSPGTRHEQMRRMETNVGEGEELNATCQSALPYHKG